jgi:flagellin
VINTNMASLVAQRNLSSSQTLMTASVEKLSSGLRINRAKDDAAGLGISQALTSQIKTVDQAARNAADAISLVQTAEGAMQEVSSMLQRMKELATQGANSALSDQQRGFIAAEVDSLKAEINKVATRTTFNKKSLLDDKAGSVATSSLVAATTTAKTAKADAANEFVTIDVTGFKDKEDFIRYTTGSGPSAATKDFAVAEDVKTLDALVTSINGATAAGEIGASVVASKSADGTKLILTAKDGVDLTGGAFVDMEPDTGEEVLIKDGTLTAARGATDDVGGKAELSLGSFAAGTEIRFTVELGTQKTFTVTTQKTVAEIRDAINGDATLSAGVLASLSPDGTKLVLTAKGASDTPPSLRNITAEAKVVSSAASGFEFQVGADADNDNIVLSGLTDIRIDGSNASATFRELETAISAFKTGSATVDEAQTLMTKVDKAIDTISAQRADLGAQQNRLEHNIANLQAQSENLQSARSRVIDTDYAAETAQMTKTQIMQQAATAMLAQANQQPNVILSLLK